MDSTPCCVRCASCRHVRKRCFRDCIFAPYFPADLPKRYESIHKIYGANNARKLLQKVPIDKRSEAAECMVFEAHSREQDPVHGCVHQISKLFHQISLAQQDLAMVKAQLAILKAQHFQQQIQQQQHASSLSELYNLHHSLTEFISIPDLAP